MALRASRQLRRVRSFYGVGAVLWAVSTAWTGWESPGDRQMWISALLLVIFTGLLLTASLWLQRLRTAAGSAGPAHRAASQRTAKPRHVHA
jgi:FtsH-binding integral membrane protein